MDKNEQQEQAIDDGNISSMSFSRLTKGLKKAIDEGILSKQQAEQIRFEQNIFKSDFTKKSGPSKKKKKHKRAIEKASRKTNLMKGTKGQKRERGKKARKRS